MVVDIDRIYLEQQTLLVFKLLVEIIVCKYENGKTHHFLSKQCHRSVKIRALYKYAIEPFKRTICTCFVCRSSTHLMEFKKLISASSGVRFQHCFLYTCFLVCGC